MQYDDETKTIQIESFKTRQTLELSKKSFNL